MKRKSLMKLMLQSILALILLISIIPLSVNAAGPVEINKENFPDGFFREYVKNYDLDNDGILSQDELDAVTVINRAFEEYGDLFNKGITTLKGIEHFTKLETLFCDANELTSIDTAAMPKSLKRLHLDNNKLEAIDLSPLTNLEEFTAQSNNLASITFGPLPNLKYLYFPNNKGINTVDFTGLDNLERLNCGNLNLDTVDVSMLPKLTLFHCGFNKLETLDISMLPDLIDFGCRDNRLTQLDLSQFDHIEYLNCDFQNRDWIEAQHKGDHYEIDMVEHFPDIDFSKIDSFTFPADSGYTYDPVTRIISIDKNVAQHQLIFYNYDVQWKQAPDTRMDVRFWWYGKYLVEFESNGGSAVDDQYVNPNRLAEEPADPEKDKHTFAGWYVDEALTTLFDFVETPITEDIVLYAKWEPVPTFNAQHVFVSGTEGMELPADVNNLLPTDLTDLETGIVVTPTIPAATEVEIADGKWTFKSWDPESATVFDEDIVFIGTWEFEEKVDQEPTETKPTETEPTDPKPTETEPTKPPTETIKPESTSPKTGEGRTIYPWIGLSLVSIGALLYLSRRKVKASRDR